MEFSEVQKHIINCISQGNTTWDEIRKTINVHPAIVTIACIKLEQELIIKNYQCNYSFFLYSDIQI